ncbi:MAG: hypothetical protein HOV66_19765 [Streptomycetaceae bacterium]|nr:hypothetical protein [Streptomycetaceae bacterium]
MIRRLAPYAAITAAAAAFTLLLRRAAPPSDAACCCPDDQPDDPTPVAVSIDPDALWDAIEPRLAEWHAQLPPTPPYVLPVGPGLPVYPQVSEPPYAPASPSPWWSPWWSQAPTVTYDVNSLPSAPADQP